MNYDYNNFKSNLVDEKKILLQKYEAIYDSVECLSETTFFKHYVSMFCFEDIQLLNLSESSKKKIDWQSFIKLSSASFFTEFNIKISHKGKIDYEITFDTLIVESKDTEPIPTLTFLGNTESISDKIRITKKISELSEWQINYFFEFYILERMSSSIKSVDERIREAQKIIGMSKVERFDSLMNLALESIPPAKMNHKVIKKSTFDFEF